MRRVPQCATAARWRRIVSDLTAVAIHGARHDPSDLAGARVLGLAVAGVQVGRVEEGLVRPREVVGPWVALAECLNHFVIISQPWQFKKILHSHNLEMRQKS